MLCVRTAFYGFLQKKVVSYIGSAQSFETEPASHHIRQWLSGFSITKRGAGMHPVLKTILTVYFLCEKRTFSYESNPTRLRQPTNVY